MFETAVLSYGPPTKRVWATFAGFTGQVALIGCALLAPLLWPQVIPKVAWAIPIVGPPRPPAPKPPAGAVVPVRQTRVISQFNEGRLQTPRVIPSKPVLMTDDAPPVAPGRGSSDGVVGGDANGVPGGLVDSIVGQARPPVLPAKPVVETARAIATTTTAPPKPTTRISQMTPATPIRRVEPIYPTLAKTAGISGRVELMGVLGTDGRIHELKVVSGHPLLIQAAVDAVKQWLFAPTILNGEPVEVQAPIQVNFVLHR
jgi:protein TonB